MGVVVDDERQVTLELNRKKRISGVDLVTAVHFEFTFPPNKISRQSTKILINKIKQILKKQTTFKVIIPLLNHIYNLSDVH